MSTTIDFITEYFYIYLWMILMTFVNIVAPVSGSTVLNPVTAFYTDPQRAIGIGAFIFFFSGIHRVYLFRKEILHDPLNIQVVKSMLPFTVIGALGGGYLISNLNIKILAAIIVVVSLYYIYKTIKQIINDTGPTKRPHSLSHIFISILTGFLQGSGMPGADIRNNYLRTILSEISVRATSSILGLINFFIGGTVILLHNRLTSKDIIFIVTLIPFLIIAQIHGKEFLDKIKDSHAKIIAVSLSSLGVVLLTYKYLL